MDEYSLITIGRRSLRGLLIALPLAIAVQAPPLMAEELELQVAGLQIVPANDSLNTTVLGTTGGTKIALLVSREGGGIISFEEESSELTSLTDDKGNSLLGEGSFGNGFGSFPTLEEDGARLLVDLEASGVPASGARSIWANGALEVAVAQMSDTFRSKKVALKPGNVINAGSIPLRISAVGPPEWGDAVLAVTLVADQEIDEIKSIRILGAEGASIDYDSGSSGSMNMMGTVTVTREFTFPEEHEAIVVEVEYWTGLRRVIVPFELEIGVGF